MKRSLAFGVVASSVLFTLWAGCGSNVDQTTFTPAGKNDASVTGGSAGQAGQAGGGGTSGGGAGEAGTGQGGSAEGGGNLGGSGGDPLEAGPDVNFGYDAPVIDVAPEACATANVEAKLKPLDMYFMIDRSGSMAGGPWTQQANALHQFWNDPGSVGITAAMRYFPISDNCEPQDSNCSGNAYVTPLVAWGVLPGNGAALDAMITNTGTAGCTPTQEALNGVLKGSKQRQIQVPSHVVVAVLVSDGEPCCDDCPLEEAPDLAQIASNYYNSSPSIRTFTLYVASVASAVMSAIAQGGGTNQSYDATNTANFVNALKAIQGLAIPCDFDMPKPDAGIVDPNEVTLEYSGTPINHISNSNQCGANGGWYYDNNTTPTKIILCPATCNVVKSDPNAKVDVSLGCLGS